MNSADHGPHAGPVRQLLASLSGMLASVIGMGRTRLALLSVEVREELQRTATLLVWGGVALIAAGGGALFAGLAIVFVFWDTHRILAAVLVTAAFLGVAIGAALMLRSRLRSRRAFLEATLAELSRDEFELRGQRK